MRIACPNCHALYDVPDNLFGGRPRRLRCEQCGHGWYVMPDGQEEAAMPSPPVATDLPVEDELIPEMSEAFSRRFGEPVDEEAKAEMQAALQDEALAHPHHDDTVPPPLPLPEMGGTTAEPDRFADLVRAARNNEVELEPHAPAKKLAQAANPRLVTLLVLLFILVLIVVERHAVMRMIPASAKLFHALHLA